MRLAGDITGAAASLIVDTVTGLPTVPFTLLLDPGVATEEVVEVTAAGGTTLTVTRGVDGTSAQSHTNGAEVRHAYSARDFQDSRNHEANTTTAHGVTGAVVGTTNTQTLSSKDLSSGTNTFPAALATLTGAQTLTNKVIDGLLPAGSITMFGGAVAPTGYLNCDGASVLQATYPALFTAIGVAYGSVDGTHFTLPNFAAAFPRGNTPAVNGGAATHQHAMTGVTVTAHTHTASMALPTHTHVIAAHAHTLSTAGYALLNFENGSATITRMPVANYTPNVKVTGLAVVTSSGGAANATALDGTTDVAGAYWTDGQTGAATVSGTTGGANTNTLTGSADEASSLPPYIGVNFIIKI